MDLNEDKLYTKLAFDEINSFLVQTFFIWSNLRLYKKKIYCSDLSFRYQIWTVYRLFEHQDDFKWKKFELQSSRSRRPYKFHIKFISIEGRTKKC
jgi:hypothetical protein